MKAQPLPCVRSAGARIVLAKSFVTYVEYSLAGGALLVIADTLSRTILAPRQLPVGALTAAIGVPLFLVLMSRSRVYR